MTLLPTDDAGVDVDAAVVPHAARRAARITIAGYFIQTYNAEDGSG